MFRENCKHNGRARDLLVTGKLLVQGLFWSEVEAANGFRVTWLAKVLWQFCWRGTLLSIAASRSRGKRAWATYILVLAAYP